MVSLEVAAEEEEGSRRQISTMIEAIFFPVKKREDEYDWDGMVSFLTGSNGRIVQRVSERQLFREATGKRPLRRRATPYCFLAFTGGVSPSEHDMLLCIAHSHSFDDGMVRLRNNVFNVRNPRLASRWCRGCDKQLGSTNGLPTRSKVDGVGFRSAQVLRCHRGTAKYRKPNWQWPQCGPIGAGRVSAIPRWRLGELMGVDATNGSQPSQRVSKRPALLSMRSTLGSLKRTINPGSNTLLLMLFGKNINERIRKQFTNEAETVDILKSCSSKKLKGPREIKRHWETVTPIELEGWRHVENHLK
ncbi:hypothetical protein HPP92_014824 [Vanilla planifolia]|uniref:Uncharacterized protein n=1 Tax=Vanilla planifolia TaxID=51239 RepID=A0A835QQA4_VANPL|nr:hypothetical protein HPP92_014824 [Vanilla planifolia]